MNYESGQDVRVGDVVAIRGSDGIVHGVVVLVIAPDTRDAADWSAPKGGILIDGAGLGLSLTTEPHDDADLVLVRRATPPPG